MSGQLEGQVAIVTGAAKGIGEAVARLFAREGAHTLITDIDEEAGESLAKELPGSRFFRVDVAVETDVAAAVDYAVATFGRLDIMVNNAGLIGAVGPIETISAEQWRSTIGILLDGPFYGIKHAARVMLPRRSGRILCTASTAALASGLGAHVYTTAKHGLIGLVKSAAVDLAPMGICVNAVAPGSTVTPLAVAYYGDVQKATEAVAAESPVGEAILPEDIAQGFLFLAGETGRKITGHTILIDGGVLATGNGSARRFFARA